MKYYSYIKIFEKSDMNQHKKQNRKKITFFDNFHNNTYCKY